MTPRSPVRRGKRDPYSIEHITSPPVGAAKSVQVAQSINLESSSLMRAVASSPLAAVSTNSLAKKRQRTPDDSGEIRVASKRPHLRPSPNGDGDYIDRESSISSSVPSDTRRVSSGSPGSLSQRMSTTRDSELSETNDPRQLSPELSEESIAVRGASRAPISEMHDSDHGLETSGAEGSHSVGDNIAVGDSADSNSMASDDSEEASDAIEVKGKGQSAVEDGEPEEDSRGTAGVPDIRGRSSTDRGQEDAEIGKIIEVTTDGEQAEIPAAKATEAGESIEVTDGRRRSGTGEDAQGDEAEEAIEVSHAKDGTQAKEADAEDGIIVDNHAKPAAADNEKAISSSRKKSKAASRQPFVLASVLDEADSDGRSVPSGESMEFVVSHISSHRPAADGRDGIELLVHWENEAAAGPPTWEPEEQIQLGARDVLAKYWSTIKGGRLSERPYEVFAIRGHKWVSSRKGRPKPAARGRAKGKDKKTLYLRVEWLGYVEETMEPARRFAADQPKLVEKYFELVGGEPQQP